MERLPAHAGMTSKRKMERTSPEHVSFRNNRNFPRRSQKWRDEYFDPQKRFTLGIWGSLPSNPNRPVLRPPYGLSGHSKHVLHDDGGRSFPHNGKLFRDFSTQWKESFHTVEKTALFFHTMEKLFASFPHNGKTFSTVWKTRISGCFRGLRAVLRGC